MVELPQPELQAWCAKRRLELPEDSVRPRYLGRPEFRLEMDIPQGCSAVYMFAESVIRLGPEQDGYFGSAFWVSNFDLFGTMSDKPPIRMFRQLLLSYGCRPAFDDRMGWLLDPTEYLDHVVLLAAILLAGWDANMVPVHGGHFVHISHDDYCHVVSTDQGVIAKAVEDLSGWNPRVMGPDGDRM
ncbi:MAG TPA: hypothetical protein VGM37_14240 [Armatimonadota bacterium]|jgi:hypothetical protein